MKKTTLCLVLMISLLLTVLAGCSSKTDNTKKSESASSQNQTETVQEDTSSISQDDVVFTTNEGVKITLNDEAAPVIEALGEPQSQSSQLSCHGEEGDDKTYVYEGFTVGTYPKNGVDRILEVVVNSEDLQTSKGIKIGDPVSKVTEIYGDNYRSIGMYYSYDAADGKSLQFFIENDVVAEIDYYYDV